MIYSEITELMRQEILDAINDKLLKIGVSTDVEMNAKTIYNGKEIVFIETKPFNTTPVIYKSITIGGSGYIEQVEGHDDVFELAFSLSYRFKYFNGGENGVDIGIITFRLFPKCERIACIGLTI